MTFNVEAFIKDRTYYCSGSISDTKAAHMRVDDVRALAAQLIPEGHVVVHSDHLRLIIRAATWRIYGGAISASAKAEYEAVLKELELNPNCGPPLPASSGPCPQCEGSGKLRQSETDATLRDCWCCNGKGIMTLTAEEMRQFAASSGQEQPKCKTCDDTKTVSLGQKHRSCECGGDPRCAICKGRIHYQTVTIADCPDCAKDRAEPSPQPVAQERKP